MRIFRFLTIMLLGSLVTVLAGLSLTLVVQARPLGSGLLTAGITVSSTTTEPGSSLVYTATVHNARSYAVEAEVSLPLPAEITYADLGHNLGTANYNDTVRSVIWTGSIPAGQTLQLSYTGTVQNPCRDETIITGKVQVDDHFYPVYADNVTSTVQSEPDMSPSYKKSVPAVVTEPGQTVTTTLHLENAGTSGAHVYITETVDSCFRLGDVSVQDVIIGPSYIHWDFDLPAGGVHTMTYRASVKEDCLTGGGVRQVPLGTKVYDSHHPEFTMDNSVQFGELKLVYLPLLFSNFNSCDPDEPNNDVTQAVSMTVGSPAWQVFSSDADVDYLVFDVPTAGDYTMQTGNLGQNTDTILYLLDDTGEVLEWNDDDGDNLWSRIGPFYLAAGRYYLKIEDYNPRQYGCDHTYSVEVEAE